MQYAISILLSGVSLGGQYALIAIGYTMVYGILRLINFAHGDVFMVAGLMMVYLTASLPLAAAIPLVLVLTVLLGFVIERAAYKPLREAPRMSVMISAIGVSYLLLPPEPGDLCHRRPASDVSGDSRHLQNHHHRRSAHEGGYRGDARFGAGAGAGPDPADPPYQGGHGHAGRGQGL